MTTNEDHGRVLGRIEQKVDQLKESGDERDEKMDSLTERVRENEHARRNSETGIGNSIELLRRTTNEISTQVLDINARVANLEAPVKRAMAARAKRRLTLVRITTIATSISVAVWFVLEPIYKVVVEFVTSKYLLGGGGGPTH